MALCHVTAAVLVYWKSSALVKRIQANPELMESLHPKLSRFFSNYLLPELLTNKLKLTGIPHDPHLREDEEDDDDDGVYCICREPAYGTMIACDGPECPNENGSTFSVLDLMQSQLEIGYVVSVGQFLN